MKDIEVKNNKEKILIIHEDVYKDIQKNNDEIYFVYK